MRIKTSTCIAAIIIAAAFSNVSADNNANNKSEKPISGATTKPTETKTHRLMLRPAGKRTNKPSSVFMTCYADNESLAFEFPENCNSMQVTLTSANGHTSSASIQKDAPYIELAGFSGEVEVECITDGNQIFWGIIEIL